MQPILVGRSFHRVGVDVLLLPLTLDDNQYAVVFKWVEVFAVPNQTARTIARLLVGAGTVLQVNFYRIVGQISSLNWWQRYVLCSILKR